MAKALPNAKDFSFKEWQFEDNGLILLPEKDFYMLFKLSGSKAKTQNGKKYAVGKFIERMLVSAMEYYENNPSA